MEHVLRCNSLKCRKTLSDFAVVTTCSHVFCVDCSNRCQLSGQREGQRVVCPACDMHLTNPDDVVVTNLNPSEDYKTSVLSGLSPNVIMECAGRALSFWTYQTTQEIVYQEYLARNLTDRFGSMNTQMDKIIQDANGEILNLRNKMSNMAMDQESLRQKNEELIQAFRDKNRKLLQTQELYDKLKRRDMLGQVQNAASDAVDHTIQASVTANRYAVKIDNQNQRPVPPPRFPSIQNSSIPYQGQGPGGPAMAPPTSRITNGDRTWAGFSSQENVQQNQPSQTPSTHRQQLAPGNIPTPYIGVGKLLPNSLSGAATPQITSTGRSPLTSLNANIATGSGFAGYGMSAGLKVSNSAGSSVNGFARPVVRSRVAQRTSSGSPSAYNPAFAPVPTGNMFSNGGNYY